MKQLYSQYVISPDSHTFLSTGEEVEVGGERYVRTTSGAMFPASDEWSDTQEGARRHAAAILEQRAEKLMQMAQELRGQ